MGGLQAQVLRQTLALSRLGVEQCVLTLPMPGAPRDLAIDERVTVSGVSGYAPAPPGREPGAIGLHVAWALGVRARLRARPSGYDLIHVHGTCVPWPLWSALSAQRILGVPLVVTVHCSILGTYRPVSRRDAAFQHLARRAERDAVARAARTIVLTERVASVLREKVPARSDRISVIPDCVDVELFRRAGAPEAAARFAERYAVPRDRPVVAYVGRISHEKGWPVLVELAQRLRGRAHVLVCGGGEDEGLLRREVAALGLAEHVTITGFVTEAEVPAALACSQLLVLPSNFEELGSVVAEAMALSRPAVAFAVGGVAEAIEDGRTGLLVPHGDVGALAGAICRLLDDPDLASNFGRLALERARERFDLPANAARIHEIYSTVG